MNFIPEFPRFLVLLQNIEKGNNLLFDSSEIFWIFCDGLMSRESYLEKMAFWKNKDPEGWLDADIKATMLRGFDDPDAIAQESFDKFDAISRAKRLALQSSETSDSISLYITTHIEAARLNRLIKVDGYSDEARITLKNSQSFFTQFEISSGEARDLIQPKFLSASIKSVGSFLCATQFLILKSDGRYEDALPFLIRAIDLLQQAMVLVSLERRMMGQYNNLGTVQSLYKIGDLLHGGLFSSTEYLFQQPIYPTWRQAMYAQLPVDCFEAIRTRHQVKDTKSLISLCYDFASTCEEKPWLKWDQSNSIKDSEDNVWEPIIYWNHSAGWAEDKLNPSDLREYMIQTEEEASEKRLQTYFFQDTLWLALPDNVRRCLVNVDRDWFSGSNTRIESVLEELRMATEQLMLEGLWQPLNKWINQQGNSCIGFKDYMMLLQEIDYNREKPNLKYVEKALKLKILDEYLKAKGTPQEDRKWCLEQLPKSLQKLRQTRNIAGHELNRNWSRQDVKSYVEEYLGIGQPGVIQKIAQIFLQSREK